MSATQTLAALAPEDAIGAKSYARGSLPLRR